jgi:hypothetical protein
LYVLVWIVSIRYGYRLIKIGRSVNSKAYIVAGGCLIAGVIFFILSQQYTQYKFTSTIFSTICGLGISFNRIMAQYKLTPQANTQ